MGSGGDVPSVGQNTFEVVDHEDLDLSAAMLVTGLPSVGVVATIATSFLVQALKLGRVASIHSAVLPPLAIVRGGRTESPIRIHAAPMVCDLDGKCDQLAVLIAELAPPPELLTPFARAILDWARRRGVREIVALEGARAEGDIIHEPRVHGVGNSEASRKRLEGLKVPLLAQGFLGGLAAPMTLLGEARGISVTCLVAETRADYPDARGAARLVELMRPMLPRIPIDPEPLNRQAELIEGQVKSALDGHRQALDSMAEQSHMMYG